MSKIGSNENVTTNTNETSKIHKGTIVKFFHKLAIFKQKRKRNFFHKTNIMKANFMPTLKMGGKCQFEISSGTKGDVASNMIIIYRPTSRTQKLAKPNNIPEKNNTHAALFTQTMQV
ncbi:unnamed protein product [Rotaria magnacalcarata]|uniref:Uncharacterized protein n=2 Tax=Rotaria magnacalcarata TaxID=392030 RepID=A0A8S2N810_9BILA|nr:unnamed protein product [Rotaria magnacalcarata]